jgi:excisionase family DNA binding protein
LTPSDRNLEPQLDLAPTEHDLLKSAELPQKQRLTGRPASRQDRTIGMPISLSGLDPILAETIEAHAVTMVDNDSNNRRRLVEFKGGCRYGKFGKTKAYELIASGKIRAYKMGGKTMIDLDSVDEFQASLPRVEARAS